MNKSFKPVFIMAVLAVFGVANAQIKVTAPKVEVTAPKVAAPAAPAAPTAPAVAAPAAPAAPTAPAAPAHPAPAASVPTEAVAAPTAPAHTAPAVPAAPAVAVPAVTAPAHAAPTAPAAPTVPVAVPAAPVHPAPAAPAVAVPAPAAVVPATPALVVPVAAEPVAEAPDAPKTDSTIVLIIEEPKKKKRSARTPKNDFAVVDVPANFEIQARKVFPITDIKDGWNDDNLDTWWGRANLMVLTESENFVGKVHLRMYPGQLYGKPDSNSIVGGKKDRYGKQEARDAFQLYEAWAWHRGDYVNVKIGRWDNTTRFGSKTFGGYVDAKKDKNNPDICDTPSGKCSNYLSEALPRPSINQRESGFMSTYTPENALQFGLNNFSENISLDVALISGDNHLNRGDLRVYFAFRDLAGLENVDIGIGYRSNVFDEIYNKRGDVTHTVDFGFRMPLIKDAGLLKSLNLFAEAALIGLDDQIGNKDRADKGGSPHDLGCDPAFPILGGLDFSFHRGLDKLVIEAEYDGKRRNTINGSKEDVKDVLGSIYIQRKLNDRFTLNLGVQSENNTKDFSFAGRLQGRIN
jgi:hypothetical protein